jgi:hypothetical protein
MMKHLIAAAAVTAVSLTGCATIGSAFVINETTCPRALYEFGYSGIDGIWRYTGPSPFCPDYLPNQSAPWEEGGQGGY